MAIDTPLIQTSIANGAPLKHEAGAATILTEAIQAAAREEGRRGIFWVGADGEVEVLTYSDVFQKARRILAGLQQRGLRPGEKLLFQIEEATEFFPVFWACVLGGFVAVPLSVPPVYTPGAAAVRKLHNAWKMLGFPWVLTTSRLRDQVLEVTPPGNEGAFRVECVETLAEKGSAGAIFDSSPEDVAVLFMTSGSTGMPKAVIQTHRSLLAMAHGTLQMNGFTREDCALNWMPLDHVGSLAFLGILPTVLRARQVHVATAQILRDPLRWLSLIQQHRATISWAPNFAFALYLKQTEAIAQGRWDLSSMKFLVNAGESIVAKTARQFLRLLQPHGLPANALRPAFGMSETCSGITWSPGFSIENSSDSLLHVPLGGPIPGASVRVVDEGNTDVPEGEPGRVQFRGPSVTPGYLGNPELQREAFHEGWFNTGDLGFLSNGQLVITGREKDVLIINGANYYSHELEAVVEEVDGVDPSFTAACAVRGADSQTEELVVFFHPAAAGADRHAEIGRSIRRKLVEQVGVNPRHVIAMERSEIPKTEIGKLQRRELKKRFEAGEYESRLEARPVFPSSPDAVREGPSSLSLMPEITRIWEEVLETRVGPNDTFFELGGHSLLIPQIQARLEKLIGRQLRVIELFNLPTVRSLAEYFSREKPGAIPRPAGRREAASHDIAVIGIACRFPGAPDAEAFWRNLEAGQESISFLTMEEVLAAGVDPALARDPRYVKAAPVLPGVELFDADFFKLTAKEARMMDPQHRVFLETAWEVFENAGYDPGTYAGRVGVYASALFNTYLINNLYANASFLKQQNQGHLLRVESMGGFNLMVTNDKDYLPTRVAYKLNLRGPALNVQTACSSTLVAVHMACESLIRGDCDMALAGGISISVPQTAGHLFAEGMLNSPDGHCRAFDADAQGTIFGNGSGAILLKPLGDAIRDGDHIHAVIKGTAINNDGAQKVGFTAPSEIGEAGVILEALDKAGVHPESVGYVESHGTGTPLGDPIEIEALTRVFRQFTDKRQFCAVGSVKTNIGHMQVASGIAGILKAILALEHRKIPATLHFRQPNPRIDFANSPFFVNSATIPWEGSAGPRRAGVNSLGIGGTNAHVILEEPPAAPRTEPTEARPWNVLTLSAKTPAALAQLIERYSDFGEAHPSAVPGDVAYTSNVGRAHWEHRRAILWGPSETLPGILKADRIKSASNGKRSFSAAPESSIVFLFTGQGAQYAGMGRELFETQPVFREHLEACQRVLKNEAGVDLFDWLWEDSSAEEGIDQTGRTQPALFALEYALCQMWQAWGLRPAWLLGHSIGECAAACCAGVFSLADGLKLALARGLLMQALPADGAMHTVWCGEEEAFAALDSARDRVSVATVNGPENVVLSGEKGALREVLERLDRRGIRSRPLQVSHAFHSPLMEPMLEKFGKVLGEIRFSPPRLRIISGRTGAPASEELATPEYWLRQVREPVRFHDGVRHLSRQGGLILIEMGPHPALLGLAKSTLSEESTLFLPSLRRDHPDGEVLMKSLAEFYEIGGEVNWSAFHQGHSRRRVPLPTYPWQRQRYWVEPTDLPRGQAVGAPSNPCEDGASLLGARSASPLIDKILFEKVVHEENPSWLRDHRVLGSCVAPGAGHLCAVVEAAKEYLGTEACLLENVIFPSALALQPGERRTVQLVLNPVPGAAVASAGFQIISFATQASQGPAVGASANAFESWSVHASGRLKAISTPPHPLYGQEKVSTEPFQGALIDADKHYESMNRRGIELGPSFRWLQSMEKGDGMARGTFRRPEGLTPAETRRFHPGLIDSTLQLLLGTVADSEPQTLIPFSLGELRISGSPETEEFLGKAWLTSRTARNGEPGLIGNVVLADDQGRVLLEAKDFEIRQVRPETFGSGVLSQQPRPFFQVLWHVKALERKTFSQQAGNGASGVWLILADKGGVGLQLAETLRRRGDQPVLAFSRSDSSETLLASPVGHSGELRRDAAATLLNRGSTDIHVLDLGNGPDWDFNGLTQRAWKGIVHLWSLETSKVGEEPDVAELHRQQESLCGSLLKLAGALSAGGSVAPPVVALVTRGCQPVLGLSEPVQPILATVWGMGRSLRLERSRGRTLLVDLDPGGQDVELLAEELFAVGNEDQIAFRKGDRYVARLTPWKAPRAKPELFMINGPSMGGRDSVEPAAKRQGSMPGREEIGARQSLALPGSWEAPAFRVDGEGVYLITGGYGALGMATADWLVDQGARRLVLMGRSKPGSGSRPIPVSWIEEGVVVRGFHGDVANPSDVEECLATIRRMGTLRGIIHAAGVLRDGLMDRQTWNEFQMVLSPKVLGAWNLHQATRGVPLDFFVLFSSVAGLLGSPAQGAYAASNAFLDALAHHRHTEGMAGLSIQWGPWAEIGMTASLKEVHKTRIAERGLRSLSPEEGTRRMGELLGQKVASMAVMPIDADRFAAQYEDVSAFYTNAWKSSASAPKPIAPDAVPEQWAGWSENRRRDEIARLIRGMVSDILGSAVDDIDPQEGLISQGLDSLMAVDLKNRLEKRLSLTLRATLIFDYPTIQSLAGYLARSAFGKNTEPPALRRPVTEAHSATAKDGQSSGVAPPIREDIAALLAAELDRR